LLVVLWVLVLFAPISVRAQSNDPPTPPTPPPVPDEDEEQRQSTQENWQELQTTYFHILYTPGDEAIANHYASFVDSVYDEIAAIFEYETEPPLTLRLYPTEESYAQVNPLAPKLPGIVAHADFRHREVAVIVPVTGNQTPEGVENNVRHELTHIIAAELSGNKLNTGFQEGIAQYLEIYVPELEGKVHLLTRASEDDRLLDWSDFEQRGKVYGQPDVSYPQTLSVVAFLVEQYGFEKFIEFLENTEESSGYRSALDNTYGISPADLETAWLEWLPSYLEGGYRHNVISSYDLSHARKLVNAGRYAEAQQELEEAIAWLQSEERVERADDQSDEVLLEAQKLLQRSKDGQYAEQLAAEARAALKRGEYERSQQLINEARVIYASLSDTRQDEVLDAYAARVKRGLQATERLIEATNLARSLQFPEARTAADEAASEFALLGDNQRFEEAVSLLRSMESRQSLAGTLLVALGLMGVVLSLWGRWFWREEEAW
jgi:hypothetical protein